MRIDLFDFMYAFQCIVNALVESIKPLTLYNVLLCGSIVLLERTDLILAHYAGIIYLPIML